MASVNVSPVFSRSRGCCRALVALAILGIIGPRVMSGSNAPDPPAKVSPTSYRLATPAVGQRSVGLLSPTIVELTLITAGGKTAPPENEKNPEYPVPSFAPADFRVTVDGEERTTTRIGFRRRPVFAPLKTRDLRIGNYIYLQLERPVEDGATVTIAYKDQSVKWLADFRETAKADPLRHSPAIHVNHVGYLPDAPKTAIVGYFLGSLGELRLAGAKPLDFQLIDTASGKAEFRGQLVWRPDRGMPKQSYQQVWEANFSDFRRPGEYRLMVEGLGASYPFFINEGVAAAFARTYALGIYHQRCGAENALPYSRFVHAACHTAPAEIPRGAVRSLKGLEEIAPDADLFPYVRRGRVDVSGGHHDAGDYSKYTVNSAGFIHHLMFAVDSFAGVAEIDNLGLPESGDGIGDLLQIAKWESDFLAKMQDSDGGFYFLVYPRDRRYEQDVLPDRGDPQIVWPKNSASTAAAVAALAQCASSKEFRKHYPKDAERYLAAARQGWRFLREAQGRFDGDIYRKFTHYGDDYKDADELAWAAVELYLATGEAEFEAEIRKRLDPPDPSTRRWGWRRMNESFGRAIRSYAFAARSGRREQKQLERRLFGLCEAEIIACADDWLRASRDSAFGLSYPEQTKRVGGGGWFFPHDYTFDLAVAYQLDFPPKADPRPGYFEAVLANLNYEAGCNPVGVSFLTGVGWKRPLDIVHQYAQNDGRILPPSGILLGSIQEGFHYMENYRRELGALCYPLDGAKDAPYPILDRWGDSFNLQTEFVIVNQARALAVTAWLLGRTALRDQTWTPATARIDGMPVGRAAANQQITVRFRPPEGWDPLQARVVWEGAGQAPAFGSEFTFTPKQPGRQWIEVEALWPDGRRAVGVVSFDAAASR